MRTPSVVLALVVAATSPSRAEGPIAVRLGAGVTGTRVEGVADPFGPALHIGIGYRVIDELAVGLHLGTTRRSESFLEGNMGPEHDFPVTVVYNTLQLGVGASWSRDRFWLDPWLGFEDNGQRVLAGGVGAGIDLYRHPSGHRVGIYAELSRARYVNEFLGTVTLPPSSTVSYRDLYSIGVSYRYW